MGREVGRTEPNPAASDSGLDSSSFFGSVAGSSGLPPRGSERGALHLHSEDPAGAAEDALAAAQRELLRFRRKLQRTNPHRVKLTRRGKHAEARNTRFCASQQKFHTVVLRGARNISDAP